jgi:hypothetical protein
MIFASGLLSGDANIGHEPFYTQVNVGIAREFLLPDDPKPMTVRFDVVSNHKSGELSIPANVGSVVGAFARTLPTRRRAQGYTDFASLCLMLAAG